MPPSADRELTTALRIAVLRLSRRLRYQRVEETLTMSQLSALGALGNGGPMTPRALADHEKIQPPSLTRILSGLEAASLVRREPHPTDGRQVVVSLTPAGRELLAATRTKRDEWLAPRLAALSEEERDILSAAAPIMERLAQS